MLEYEYKRFLPDKDNIIACLQMTVVVLVAFPLWWPFYDERASEVMHSVIVGPLLGHCWSVDRCYRPLDSCYWLLDSQCTGHLGLFAP